MEFTTFKELDLDLIKTMASGLKEEAKKNFEEQYYLIYDMAINDFLASVESEYSEDTVKTKDRIYLILKKYSTEWTSTETKIANILNNAFLYELVKEHELEIISSVIDVLIKENEGLIEKYPQQEEEFKTVISCLTDYKEIIETTIEIGFNYYSNLVIVNSTEVEEELKEV